jgi:hypothetical protein
VFQVAETIDSILDSIKKKLMLDKEYDVFDLDIQTHINSVFMNLHQLGIGPVEGFAIEDAEATWDTFLGASHSPLLNSVKSYIYFKVKLAFDPPPTSFHIQSLEKQIAEIEWRLLIMRDELAVSDTGVVAAVLPDDTLTI